MCVFPSHVDLVMGFTSRGHTAVDHSDWLLKRKSHEKQLTVFEDLVVYGTDRAASRRRRLS